MGDDDMYLVLTIVKEGQAVNCNSLPLTFIDKDSGLAGMMPVYETREQAKKIFPDRRIEEIIFEGGL